METLRGKIEAEVDGLDRGRLRFISVSVWVKLGTDPLVNIKFDSDFVSGLRCSRFSQIEDFLCNEVSLLLASIGPGVGEPRAISTPRMELPIWRELWISFKEL